MAGHSYSHEKKVYTGVLGGLVTLTIITVLAAGVNFGSPSTNTVVALVIASMKASLVALFFMHLKYDKPINAIIFGIGIATLSLFLIFTLLDHGSRRPLLPLSAQPPPGGPPAVAARSGQGETVAAQETDSAEEPDAEH